MPRANSDNPAAGRAFEELAARVLSGHLGVNFGLSCGVPIGTPPKPHVFDLATQDQRFIGEAKCFTWTETGNEPSAKLITLNQAVFYFSFLPDDVIKFIVMKRDCHPRTGKPLAYLYYSRNAHLLRDVHIWEIDEQTLEVFEARPEGMVPLTMDR